MASIYSTEAIRLERGTAPKIRRSYGDSCLNEDGILLDASPLRRILSFDRVQMAPVC